MDKKKKELKKKPRNTRKNNPPHPFSFFSTADIIRVNTDTTRLTHKNYFPLLFRSLPKSITFSFPLFLCRYLSLFSTHNSRRDRGRAPLRSMTMAMEERDFSANPTYPQIRLFRNKRRGGVFGGALKSAERRDRLFDCAERAN